MPERQDDSSPRKLTPRGIAPFLLGFVLGASGYLTMGRGFAAIDILGDPLANDAIFRTSLHVYVVLLAIAALIYVGALFAALDEFKMRVVVSFGVGLLIVGVWCSASQQIELQPDRFIVRSGLLFTTVQYRFEPGDVVEMQIEPRPGSRFGDRHSVHYLRADGTDIELCPDTRQSPIWVFATPHLIRASRRHLPAQ